MAAIDKIYLKSFETFTEFKKWCEAQPPIKDKYGREDKISNYLFYGWFDPKYWENDNCHPVMNAPYYIDAYIIRNCPIEEVQEELMVNYGHWSQKRIKEYYENVKNWEGDGECLGLGAGGLGHVNHECELAGIVVEGHLVFVHDYLLGQGGAEHLDAPFAVARHAVVLSVA